MPISLGDIAFVGINTAGTDWFAFAALNDIAGGSVLYFTDNELPSSSSTSFNAGESYLKWVAPAGGVAAGTVVNFTQLPANPTAGTTTGAVSTGTFTAIGNLATSQNTGLSNSQDALYAYTAASDASADTPTAIIAMISIGATPDPVPSALSGANAKFAVQFATTSDSAYFSGSHSGQPAIADYAALIGNTANWTLGANETTNATLNTAPFVATPPASLSVDSPSISEGNSGTKLLTFTVTLSSAASQTVSVDYATADGTATVAGQDYAAASGTLIFNPGELTKTVTVTINGDQAIEANENFSLVLSSPVNATIATGTGTGTLTNDDVTLTGDDHFTVAVGDAAIAAATPITWDVTTGATAGGVVVTNAGIIQSTASVAISAPAATATTAASLTVQNSGQIQGATGAIQIAAGLNGGTLGLSNTGTIDGGTGRAINVSAYSGAETISLYNDTTGVIQSGNDGLRVTGSGTFAGVVDVDNWGTIHSTAGGQGIDLADLAPAAAGQLYVTNEDGASILADDNDGLRAGAFTNVQNYGLIKGASAGNTGADGIDAQSNAGVSITNYAGATIQGARHGITGSAPIAVTNFGTILAEAGSGLNMDTVGSSVMTVVNELGGVITGTAAQGKDGDGVDVDGQVDITNRGTIQALGQTPGENNEGLAIGGGTVTNWGTIYSDERAIKVDDSNNGNAYAGLNLTNHGTITAGTLEAVLTIGSFANTIVNDGTITGDIVTGSGNDTITNTGTLNGNVSTGAGNDTVAAGSGNQVIDAGAGDDQIDGGTGDDTARFSGTIAGATLSRFGSTITVTSADGVDQLTNVESLQFADGTIIASSINTAPVLTGTQATLAHGTEDTAYTVTLGDLLAGFSDAEGDALAVTGLTSNHGSVVDNGDGTFTIAPTANYNGSATLSYTVTDGLGGTAAASLGYVIDEVVDTFTGTGGNDNLTGTTGADVLIGLAGNDRLDGGAGNDTASYAGAGAVVVDLRLALPQATGGAGRDTLVSIENLIGSSNNDRLTGDNNANTLDGGDGVDKLYGVGGNDHLLGGAGNDLLDGGSGADTMEGGIGNDTYYVDNLGDVVIESAAGGTDTVYSDVNFTLSDNVEKLYLTSGQSKIGIGNALANTIQASDASATLSGLAGNDTIKGGAGADTLTGGFGKDMLTGGAGADTFVFDVFETSANRDTVTDFVAGTDKIALSVAAYTSLAGYGLGALDNGELAIGPAANVPGQHLIYNNVNGALYYDADGFGGAAQVQIATISGHPALTASDFILI